MSLQISTTWSLILFFSLPGHPQSVASLLGEELVALHSEKEEAESPRGSKWGDGRCSRLLHFGCTLRYWKTMRNVHEIAPKSPYRSLFAIHHQLMADFEVPYVADQPTSWSPDVWLRWPLMAAIFELKGVSLAGLGLGPKPGKSCWFGNDLKLYQLVSLGLLYQPKMRSVRTVRPTSRFGGQKGVNEKFNDRIRQLEVKLVSNETSKGINHAVNSIIEHRSGMDVRLGSSGAPLLSPSLTSVTTSRKTGGALRSHENKPGSDQGFRMGFERVPGVFVGPKLAVNSVGYLSYLPISSNFGLWLKSSSNSIPCFPRVIRGLHITIAVISLYPNLCRLLPWLCPPNALTAPPSKYFKKAVKNL